MKKNRFLTIALAAFMAAMLITGCAGQTPAATPAATAPAQTTAATEAPSVAPAASAATQSSEKPALNVVALKGPTGMGMVELMQRSKDGEASANYNFTLAAAPDEISGKLVTGEVDIAAVPVNLAAALYNKTQGKVTMIAVNTLGVLYVLENGDSVKSVADLAGKTLYAIGQGATPEYILNYLLEKSGVAGKVTVQYMTDQSELATLLAADQQGVKLAMLPEPSVTAALLKNKDLRVALDLTAEWNKISGGTQLVQGCLVVRNDVLSKDRAAVDAFLKEYAVSTAFTNDQPADAAKLMEAFGVLPSAAAAQAAIKKCNIVCLTGADMKSSASAMLATLFAADPKSVGGKLPGGDFYYMGE